MQISKRLQIVCEMVTPGSRVADIGTDHGYVPIWLLLEGIIPSAIGMDIRKGPLERAEEHRARYGLADKLTLRLSDGMTELSAGEADSLVIAGMGGELMIRILENGSHLFEDISELVLSPQSEIASVRRYICRNGWRIDDERMVEEDGKFYVVIRASHGQSDYVSDCDFMYGKRLLENGDEVAERFLERERRIAESLLAELPDDNERQKERKKSIGDKLSLINIAQNSLQKK